MTGSLAGCRGGSKAGFATGGLAGCSTALRLFEWATGGWTTSAGAGPLSAAMALAITIEFGPGTKMSSPTEDRAKKQGKNEPGLRKNAGWPGVHGDR